MRNTARTMEEAFLRGVNHKESYSIVIASSGGVVMKIHGQEVARNRIVNGARVLEFRFPDRVAMMASVKINSIFRKEFGRSPFTFICSNGGSVCVGDVQVTKGDWYSAQSLLNLIKNLGSQ